MSEGDNVVPVSFGGSPFRELADLHGELRAVITGYNARVPFALVLGVLRVIEHELIVEQTNK